jgi:hypothetical protein
MAYADKLLKDEQNEKPIDKIQKASFYDSNTSIFNIGD